MYKQQSVEQVQRIPRHIALIPDGNRRWAVAHGMKVIMGHYTSGTIEHVKSLLEEARKLGVRYFSIWGFSTENWKRDDEEVKAIFKLILTNVKQCHAYAHEHQVCFRHIGRKDRLPQELLDELAVLEAETKDYRSLQVQLCLDYGGRDELVRAINKLLQAGINQISEQEVRAYLDSPDIPDPDLIIRTSGEFRTSGFMPYQAAYAELYFTDKHFPEFMAEDLQEAVAWFSRRERRFGGNSRSNS